MSVFNLHRPLVRGATALEAGIPNVRSSRFDLEVEVRGADSSALYGASVEVASGGTVLRQTVYGADTVTLRVFGDDRPHGRVRVHYLGRLVAEADLDQAVYEGDTTAGAVYSLSLTASVPALDTGTWVPTTPTGLVCERHHDDVVVASWTGDEPDGAAYRVFVDGTEVAHLREARVAVTGINPSSSVTVEVAAEASDGTRSASVSATSPVQVTSPVPAFWLTSAVPSVDVAVGGTGIWDFSDVLVGFEGNPTRTNLWVVGLEGHSDQVTVSINADTVEFEPNEAGAIVVAVLRFYRPGKAPLYAACVGGDGAGSGHSIGGLMKGSERAPLTWTGLVGPDAVAVELVHDRRHVTDLSVETEGQDVSVRTPDSVLPALGVVRGQDGYGAVVLGQTPGARSLDLPLLPTFSGSVETDTLDFVKSTVQYDDLVGTSFQRTLVSGGGTLTSLFDTGYRHLPKPVYWAAPLHYVGVWLDAELYPDDAVIVRGQGEDRAVRYDGDFLTAEAAPTPPVVTDLEASAAAEASLRAGWTLLHPNDPTQELDVPVPVLVDGEPVGWGRGSIVLRDLPSQTSVSVSVLGTSVAATTSRSAPTLAVRASFSGTESGGTYTYEYTLEDTGWVAWAPVTLGGDDENTDEVTFERSDRVDEHWVRVEWGDGEQRLVRARAVWILTTEAVEFQADVEVGTWLSPRTPEPLRFGNAVYAGSRTKDYPARLYQRPGTYTVFPVGVVPPQAGAWLRDLVSCRWIGPDGRELGDTTTIDGPTTLGVRITVQARNGHTPYVYDYGYDYYRAID